MNHAGASCRGWADRLEWELGFWWLVIQVEEVLIAFYRGHVSDQGVYHTGTVSNPQQLWTCIRNTQDESRRWAREHGKPLPPMLGQQLPAALRRAQR